MASTSTTQLATPRIAYDTFGDPADPPLVLIQGHGAQLLGWQPGFCEALAAEGFHVVRFDNRDVGLSQKYPDGGYSLADLADDTVALLDGLGLDSAHIVGQSMGGMVAQLVALNHPARVRSLGLVYTTPGVRFFIGGDAIEQRMDAPRPTTREEFVRAYPTSEAACASAGYEQDLDWLADLAGQLWDRDYDPDGAERQLAAALGSADTDERLRGLAVPTAIIAGDSDLLIDPAASSALHELIPGSTLTILPGMGHELPRPLWTRIAGLLADNARTPARSIPARKSTAQHPAEQNRTQEQHMDERESSGFEPVVAEGFEPVAAAFADVLAHSASGGAAVTVIVDGVTVVDLWGGLADARETGTSPARPWVDTTTSVVFSMTKGLLALLVARLVEEGSIDLDAPVARYWPEFAQAGKEAITVRDVMSHRAGLSYPVEDITRDDILRWTPVIEKLQAQRPSWQPGSTHVYHALTYGWLVGEVVRRVTGLGVDAAFERYLAVPAGARFWVGLPTDELSHVSNLVPGPGFHFALPPEVPFAEQIVRALTLGDAFPDYVAGDGTGLNDPALQQAVVPAGLGIGTARAVATLWSAAIIGMPGVDPVDTAVLDDMTVPRSSGEPAWSLPGLPWEAWGTGFHVPSDAMPLLGPTSFGHAGAGGQLSFADRQHRLAFAFVTNDLQAFDDHRVETLLAALHASLDSGAAR